MLSSGHFFILAILWPEIIAIPFSNDKRVFLEVDHDIEHWKSAGWKLTHRVLNEKVRLAFAIKHQNLAKLEEIFWSVSDPKSEEYGRHLNMKEINNLVKPADESMNVVKSWLQEGGVDSKHCHETMNSDYIICEISSVIAEILLNGARFYRFHHKATSKSVIRSITHYSVPGEVAKHLDFVSGSLRFPALKSFEFASSERAEIGGAHSQVYPTLLRSRYNVADKVGTHPNNKQAVAQFLEEYYSPADLKEFFAIFGRGFTHHSDVTKVVGPNSGRSGIEASLDVQYIMSLGANISTWFWSTGGRHESQEPFLEWIIAIGNMSEVPNVFSVSYGDNEDSLSVDYMNRINVEFMKAGVRGITILFASGDDGAGCHKNKSRPEFPSSSPYVTAVGGTGFNNRFGIDGEYGHEISGGGFSNVFKRPSYQESAVNYYLQNSGKLPKASLYSKTGRGYPDISAVCNHYWIVNNLVPLPDVMGTSASTPTVAGIISLVNDMRLQNNKSPMGFINPFLYSNMKSLHDTTSGYNRGCGGPDHGFYAFVGWDPVTGCGTPNYPAMVEAALKS